MKKLAFEIGRDPRETPRYPVQVAAGYLNIPRGTLRHWLRKPKGGRALIEAEGDLLSFYNLAEAHIIKVAVDRDSWLKLIRDAVATLRQRHQDDPHPLLREARYTGGTRSLYSITDGGLIEDLSKGGQLLIREFRRKLNRIDWDEDGRAYQIRPHEHRHVAINYRVAGGQPVILGTGILIDTVVRRVLSGESPVEVAADYGIKPSDVREAIKYVA